MEVRPEMSGKIIDRSHLDFHVTCKAKIIGAFNKLKQGKDFLKTLAGYKFRTDKRWVRNSCGDPSVKALTEILEEYKESEHRPNRGDILYSVMEYAIGLYASDLFYRERGSWLINRIIERRQDFLICQVFKDPNQWYPMTRNHTGQGVEGDLYKEENNNPPDINKEYAIWYDIDIEGEQFECPEERMKSLIQQGLDEINQIPDCPIKAED
jgi:hypothetical protein